MLFKKKNNNLAWVTIEMDRSSMLAFPHHVRDKSPTSTPETEGKYGDSPEVSLQARPHEENFLVAVQTLWEMDPLSSGLKTPFSSDFESWPGLNFLAKCLERRHQSQIEITRKEALGFFFLLLLYVNDKSFSPRTIFFFAYAAEGDIRVVQLITSHIFIMANNSTWVASWPLKGHNYHP